MSKPHAKSENAGHAGEKAAARSLGFDRGQTYNETKTMQAWERFLTGDAATGRLPVRRMIEHSWARSVASGVDAHGSGSPLVADEDQFHRLRRENRELLAAAAHTFEHSARLLEGTSAMVILTDRNGTILETGGDTRTIDAGHDISLERGGSWNESVVGTNGIGTALSTGKPVFVHAAEHFCEGVKSWTCAGAPIRDPLDRSVVGLIDISGPIEIFQGHNVAMAVVAAEQIELALGERARAERLRLLEACLSTMPGGNSSDVVVVLDRQGRVIHLSDGPLPAQDGTAGPVDLSIGRRLADLDGVRTDRDIFDRLPEHLHPSWLKPLLVGDELSGAILIYAGSRQKRRRRTPPAASIPVPSSPRMPVIVGQSEALQNALTKAKQVARSRASVLLEGETGVGKELFAQLIHTTGSTTGNEPYIVFNCGAVSKDLIGAELFGHVAGAYTGATREGRRGRFELAQGGTLCLDEIGELPLDLQPYLLRVLEEGVVYRLGEGKPRPIDVRLVSSTNRNLKEEVAAGRFRQDLYYRIRAVAIDIPPLRDRTADIAPLIDHFNAMFAAKYGVEPLHIDEAARQALVRHGWPGNARELRNLIESLTLMSTDREVALDDLSDEIRQPSAPGGDPRQEPVPVAEGVSLEDAEREAIVQAIEAGGGNLSLVAKQLKISRSTLYRKLKQYGLRR